MKKKNIFKLLKNADAETLDKLAERYPAAGSQEREKIYRMIGEKSKARSAGAVFAFGGAESHRIKRSITPKYIYGLGSMAAAAVIAAGSVVFSKSYRPSKPDISESSSIISENDPITSTAPSSQTTVTAKTVQTAKSTVTTVKTTASEAKTSTSLTEKTPDATTLTSAAATAEAAKSSQILTSVTAAVSTQISAAETSAPVQEFDYEYEGSIIMKKYAAALSAILAAGSVNAMPAQAQTYEPKADSSYEENELIQLKNIVDQYDPDLDINCDGNFDIFDAYAFYRAGDYNMDMYSIRMMDGNIPDYIQEKYNALKDKEMLYEVEKIDPDTNELTTYTYNYSFSWYNLVEYLFTYCPVKLDYFDPNYYIDNCPDDYNDPIPMDVLRKDVDVWDILTFKKNKYYLKNDDGSYRLVCADDYTNVGYDPEGDYYSHFEFQYEYTYAPSESDENDYDTTFYKANYRERYYSPIYSFIDEMRYWAHGTRRDYKNIKDFMEGGYVDTDINSDGVFDFDDVIIIDYVSDYVLSFGEPSSLYVASPKIPYFNVPNPKFGVVTEEEVEKAVDFCKVAANYFYDKCCYDIGQYVTQYYLTYNEIDDKYFDPVYYEDKGYYTPRPYSCDRCVFANLSYYEEFSIKYGPNSSNNSPDVYEVPARYNFTDDQINSAFPTYYKKVKTGMLPKPDIDLDGKITAADYNILYNLDLEYFTPYDTSYMGTMIKRHPELEVKIGVSQEVRDNFETNFDFNNNGISADELEVQCMLMYILHDLEVQYNDEDKMNKDIDRFYVEHPELQYYEVFNENLEYFNRAHGRGDSGYVYEDEKMADFSDSVETVKRYASYSQISLDDLKGNGDANGDGTTDLADAVLIMQALSNPSKYGTDGSAEKHITNEGFLRADVDGGGVTNMDALAIQKYLLGLFTLN